MKVVSHAASAGTNVKARAFLKPSGLFPEAWLLEAIDIEPETRAGAWKNSVHTFPRLL